MHFAALLVAALPVVSAQSGVWGQCKWIFYFIFTFFKTEKLIGLGGGIGWTGSTSCVSGSCCTYSNDWYSQCLPCSGGGDPDPEPTTTGDSTVPTSSPITWNTFSNVKIFGPGNNYNAPGVLYA